MNEIDVLRVFYDAMKARGITRHVLFLNIDDNFLKIIQRKFGNHVHLDEVRRFTDACIANEWLERTTADPGYHFLSLTEAGLQMVLTDEYLSKRGR